MTSLRAARKEAKLAERDRFRTVFASACAKRQMEAATALAMATDMSAGEIIQTLAEMPADVAAHTPGKEH